jgi:pSer/pThr/pTyr-binding forkhead associated (FHA) protein
MLSQIDTRSLEDLRTIKREQEVLDERLAAMEKKRVEVADAVYLRVRADYESRRDALEASARPLKDQVRTQYASLKSLLERARAQVDETELNRQELEFRFSLGEYDQGTYAARLKSMDDELAERKRGLEEAQTVRQEFISAFRSESELDQPVSAAPVTAPVTIRGATKPLSPKDLPIPTDATMVMPPSLPDAPATAIAPPPIDPSATTQRAQPTAVQSAMAAPTAAPASAPAQESSTVVFRPGRLIVQGGSNTGQTITLSLKPVLLGSDQHADIKIEGAGVAARHARISVSYLGYSIEDLSGGLGTRVNGKKVSRDQLLANEDVVQIGSHRFIFKYP